MKLLSNLTELAKSQLKFARIISLGIVDKSHMKLLNQRFSCDNFVPGFSESSREIRR